MTRKLGWRGPLRTTLIGIASFPLSFIGGVGPCGPSSPLGLVLMILGVVCLPLGILWFVGRGVFRVARKFGE
jgi:hypothetical protein